MRGFGDGIWVRTESWLIMIFFVPVSQFKGAPAVPCGNSGNFNGLFCCSVEADTSCCNATFGNVFGKPFAPTTLASTTTTIANDTNSTDASAVTTTTVTAMPVGRSTGSDATKVGVGVGVPLGLMLLLSLIFAAWTERRRRRDLERVARETGWVGGLTGREKGKVDGMNGFRFEVEGGGREIQELGEGRSP